MFLSICKESENLKCFCRGRRESSVYLSHPFISRWGLEEYKERVFRIWLLWIYHVPLKMHKAYEVLSVLTEGWEFVKSDIYSTLFYWWVECVWGKGEWESDLLHELLLTGLSLPISCRPPSFPPSLTHSWKSCLALCPADPFFNKPTDHFSFLFLFFSLWLCNSYVVSGYVFSRTFIFSKCQCVFSKR